MLTSYHVHTIRSDGEATARAHAVEAIRLAIEELGISDHYVIAHSDNPVDWSMSLEELPTYRDEVLALAEEMRGRIVIRLGIEADFDPANHSDMADILREFPFDYVIGSVHFVDGFPIDYCKNRWDEITQSERNDIVLGYWDRIEQMAKSKVFDFVGHLDLYKKFGYLPTVDISHKVQTALDAIAASGMPVEINTSGAYKPIQEMYPSEWLLRECRKRSIPILITADAHVPEDLMRGYCEARELAARVGYDHLAAFDNRRYTLTPFSA